MTPTEIRKEIANRKSQILKTCDTSEIWSTQIVKRLQNLDFFKKAKTIGAYIPLPDEVDISPLFERGSFCLEKTFYIPAFDEASGGYRLAEYTQNINPGKFGIPEPSNPIFAPTKLDVILVPGIAFDLCGHRMGRGGGFYDRLLPQHRAVCIGVCFDFQCLPVLPTQPHDYPVDLLVTESRIRQERLLCL